MPRDQRGTHATAPRADDLTVDTSRAVLARQPLGNQWTWTITEPADESGATLAELDDVERPCRAHLDRLRTGTP